MKLLPKLILLVCTVVVAVAALFQAINARDYFETADSDYSFKDIVSYDPDQKYLPEQRWGRDIANRLLTTTSTAIARLLQSFSVAPGTRAIWASKQVRDTQCPWEKDDVE